MQFITRHINFPNASTIFRKANFLMLAFFVQPLHVLSCWYTMIFPTEPSQNLAPLQNLDLLTHYEANIVLQLQIGPENPTYSLSHMQHTNFPMEAGIF